MCNSNFEKVKQAIRVCVLYSMPDDNETLTWTTTVCSASTGDALQAALTELGETHGEDINIIRSFAIAPKRIIH